VVPGSWDAEGHILRGGVEDPPPAEVTFGVLASRTLDPVDRAGAPTYANGRCSNVYCHGGVLHDGGGTDPSPRWEDPAAPGSCVHCHGQPPPTHAQTACATCHPPGAPHLDGIVQVGRTSGCSGCHGDASSPAPPNDLSGNTLITAIGVGAHRKHLLVPTQLRGPIPCATCHQVPTAVDDPGHIDSPLPAEVNDVLGWDRSSRTCTTAACHGPSRPVWTAQGGVTCGSCHGVPPTRSPHLPNMTPLVCVSCHPQTIDAAGTIILTPGPDGLTSTHMNGTVDVR
jgi:predicted CxxxxCH...CXXCH cytochrome family protein